MKQFIKILRGAGATLLAAALAAACSVPFEPSAPQNYSSAPQISSGTGTAVIRTGNDNGPSLTIMPTAPDSFSRYELTLTKGATTVTPPDTTGIAGEGVAVELESGNWTATVNAYRQFSVSGGAPSEYLAATGSAALTVTIGGTNAVTVTVAPVAIADAAGVKGIFSWAITLPEGLSSAELRLGDAAPVNLLAAAAGSVEVAAGTYNLFVTMTKGGLNAGLYEWVYIYPGLESPAVFDFGAGGADELVFTDTVLLAGTVSASIPAGVTRPFTVKAYSDAACTNDITATGSTTSITANGGTWLLKIPASSIGQNVYLKATPAGANGHTPTPGTATVTALPANGQAGIALNIDVQVGITLDYLAEYLASLPVSSASVPTTVPLAASVVINTEDINPNGVWATVNSTVNSKGKSVILDLSACTAAGNTITGASVNPTLNQMNIIKNNPNIRGIILPNTLTSIGSRAFSDCIYTRLTSVTIPGSVTSIGQAAFVSCVDLESVTIPGSVTSIGQSAFASCTGLTSVTFGIDSTLASIGDNAFFGCTNLTSVTIPNSVTSIGETAFASCTGLMSVTIPGSVTSFGQQAFDGCTSLRSVTILNGVKSIGDYAFLVCTSLTSVTIPGSVTSIGYQAFSSCSDLTSVIFGSGSNIADGNFGSGAFPQDSAGAGGNNLRTLYLSPQDERAGTYRRASTSASEWTKDGRDYTPPVLSLGGKEDLISTTGNTATLKFTSNEAGTYYYRILAASAGVPSATTIRDQGIPGNASASENRISITGLTAATNYTAYIIVEDAMENKQVTPLTITGVITKTQRDPYIIYGYDVLNNAYINNNGVNKTRPILNVKALNNAGKIVQDDSSPHSVFDSYAGSSIKQVYEKVSNSVGIGLDFGAFGVGVDTKFSKSTFESTTNQFVTVMARQIKSEEWVEYGNTAQLTSYLTESFIADIKTQTAAYILNAYGTHLITRCYFGGVAEANFSYNASESTTTEDVEIALKVKIKSVEPSVGTGTESSNFDSTSTTKFYCETIGGMNTAYASLGQFMTGYPDWVASLTTASNNQICGIANASDSMVAIWELVSAHPDPVIAAKASALQSEYNNRLMEKQFELGELRTAKKESITYPVDPENPVYNISYNKPHTKNSAQVPLRARFDVFLVGGGGGGQGSMHNGWGGGTGGGGGGGAATYLSITTDEAETQIDLTLGKGAIVLPAGQGGDAGRVNDDGRGYTGNDGGNSLASWNGITATAKGGKGGGPSEATGGAGGERSPLNKSSGSIAGGTYGVYTIESVNGEKGGDGKVPAWLSDSGSHQVKGGKAGIINFDNGAKYFDSGSIVGDNYGNKNGKHGGGGAGQAYDFRTSNPHGGSTGGDGGYGGNGVIRVDYYYYEQD